MRGPRPYELAATTPSKHLVPALVRNLAEVLGGQAVYGTQTATGTVPVASWPVAATLTGDVAQEPVDGGGIVLVAGVRRWGDAEHAVLRETALWLGMAGRLARLTGDHDRASVRAAGLRAELSAARERLAQVRDLERRRLVGAITTTTLRDLAEVRGRLTGITADTAADDLAEARGALDDLIDDFRAVVRGVYPAMLPDRGPRAALEELAATLPRPVRFGGDLGRRAGWQVESGLYHAVAAVLNVLAGLEAEGPIEVRFDRDDALRVRVTAAAGGLPATELRTTLGHDAQRIAVLGGAMECAVRDGVAVVNVRVADRIEPAEPAVTAPPLEESPLYRQVLDLVRQGQEAATEQDRPRWDAVAERMPEQPRLALVGASEHPPGVTVVPVRGPADEALAEEFLADDGVDAVLCLVPPTPAFRAALRWGRQRVELSESAGIDQLAGKLVAWRPVVAARRALVAATELVRTLPENHPLRWAVDRVRAEAHEIAELDLLDDLQRGDSRLLRGRDVDAARLLGANGTGSRARLGLPEDADDTQVQAAARDAAGRWRGHAEHPATGGRDRVACEVLARTAEGLLSQ
jgi:hypothetical protein